MLLCNLNQLMLSGRGGIRANVDASEIICDAPRGCHSVWKFASCKIARIKSLSSQLGFRFARGRKNDHEPADPEPVRLAWPQRYRREGYAAPIDAERADRADRVDGPGEPARI